MRFLNESVRREFHLLSVGKQQAMQDADDRFKAKGFELFILMVDQDEISLRVAELIKDASPNESQV